MSKSDESGSLSPGSDAEALKGNADRNGRSPRPRSPRGMGAVRSYGRTGLGRQDADRRRRIDLTELGERALHHTGPNDQHDLPASGESDFVRPEEFASQAFRPVTIDRQRQVLLGGDNGETGRSLFDRLAKIQKKRPAIESRAFLAEAVEIGRGANSTLPRETHGGLGSAEALAADGTALGQNLTATGGLGTGAETALAGAGDLRRTIGRMHGCKGTAKDTPSRVSSPTLPGLADGL